MYIYTYVLNIPWFQKVQSESCTGIRKKEIFHNENHTVSKQK